MEIQDMGLTDGSVTCKMVTYMSINLFNCKASFFLIADCFLQAMRLYPLTLAIVSSIRAACKLAVIYL